MYKMYMEVMLQLDVSQCAFHVSSMPDVGQQLPLIMPIVRNFPIWGG